MTRTMDLGARIAAFHWDRKRARRLFLVHFPLALIHLPLAFAIIGLPGLLLFGYFALRSWRRWSSRTPAIELHEHGGVDHRGAHSVRFRYEELHRYQLINRVLRFPFPFSFLSMHGMALTASLRGRHFLVNEHIEDIAACIATLQAGILRQRLPTMRAALEAGEMLRFGPFAMSNAGISLGRRLLAWEQMAGVRGGSWQMGRQVDPALMFIDANGQRWDVATRSGLADPALFIALIADRKPLEPPTLLRDFCGLPESSMQ
ncbi:MAG TPA: DUF6585 family protein [Gammaproteobacteria bacterium]|nr:DUF6585 family protein [Gammaproteobacteria bacterium]